MTDKELTTRADLMNLPAWQDLDVDSSGNPIVWMNWYSDERGTVWNDAWSCQCDDDDGYSPFDSEWIGPRSQEEQNLWESLPEAGA